MHPDEPSESGAVEPSPGGPRPRRSDPAGAGPSESHPPRRGRPGAFGGVFAAVWGVALALTLWSGPWPASLGSLTDDLAAGRVSSWSLQNTSPADPLGGTGLFGEVVSFGFHRGSSDADTVVWRDDLGRVRWCIVSPSAPQLDARAVATGDVAAARRAWLTRAAPGLETRETGPSILLQLPAGILTLVTLMLVFGGREPRRGTRWFWFWITLGLPAGAGIPLFALLEHGPSSRPVPADSATRRTGGTGFRFALLGSIVVGLIGAVLVGVVAKVAGS